jgi:hypothetical protein
MGFLIGSVQSWSDFCRQFVSNFRVTYEQPGVEWDLANIVQKEGNSLYEFIQCFYNKRNIILEVDDKSIITFFKKGFKDSLLIRKLAMKNPRTLEEMLAITNKYVLAEEATLNTKEAKKDKKSNHSNRAKTFKSNYKKRKHDRFVANVEQSSRNMTKYWPRWASTRASWMGCASSILKESTRLKTATSCKYLQMRYSRRIERSSKRTRQRIQRAIS